MIFILINQYSSVTIICIKQNLWPITGHFKVNLHIKISFLFQLTNNTHTHKIVTATLLYKRSRELLYVENIVSKVKAIKKKFMGLLRCFHLPTQFI